MFTPYEVVYGLPPARLQAYIPRLIPKQTVDELLLKSKDQIMTVLKTNLLAAQERMELYYDKNRTERQFIVGDWVFLWL